MIGNFKKNINSIFILLGIIFVAYIILELIGNIKERFDAYYFPRMENHLRFQIIDAIFKKLSINYESINKLVTIYRDTSSYKENDVKNKQIIKYFLIN